jgi:hypothetical protein
MAHTVKLNAVWLMLEECAKGYTKRDTREYWLVSHNGKTYRSLPLGPHGRRHNPDIESGHVRSLIRHLGISRECADAHLDLG